MVDRLTGEDLQWLDTYKRLVEHVTEQPHNGGLSCARLKHYRNIANYILAALERIDQDTTQSHSGQRPLLKKNDRLRENWIAQAIKDNDRNLLGMLKSQKLEEKKEYVCSIYARMVMGHEHDKDLERLLEGLKDLGVIKASTCG
jgi:hypothetical protein